MPHNFTDKKHSLIEKHMNLLLVPVSGENREIATSLAVAPGQEHFIETVEECLQEADELAEWRPMLICDGDIAIGFTMFGYLHYEGKARLWFDRFLIDRNYQHQGYGRMAMKTVLGYLRGTFPEEDIYLSVYDENQVAIRLYQSFGFSFNGELDLKGERVMVLKAERE